MFGLGTWEIILILVVALIFIGPDKLPQVARSIGKGMKQVRSAMSQVDHQVRKAADDFVNAQDTPPPAAPPAAETAGDEDEDADHQILRAPADSPKNAPPLPPGATAEAAESEAAPGSTSAEEGAGTPVAPRDWNAHVARPVEGRVAAARPGRRPSTIVEDPGDDPEPGDETPKDGEPS